jgi:hypothetical protein
MQIVRVIVVAFWATIAMSSAMAAADKIKISPAVWADFQRYLENVGGARKGAYAVTADGMGAMGTFCPQTKCKPTLYTTRAVEGCEQANPGLECIVFAENRDIVVDYEIGE